ncbi:LTA synthase family protein [Helicobacter sp. 23-1044]
MELGADEQSRYSPHGELIPNLTNFAQNGINFSANYALGGHFPTSNTGSTISATVAYFCGVPFKISSAFHKHKNDILPNATCIGDILGALGYNQSAFTGAKAPFGGYENFIKNQHIKIFDADYFVENGLLEKKENWGVNDYDLFSFAKKYLEDYDDDAPFALFISTIDSHYPGFVDKNFCADLEENYANSVRCSDKIIGDFVRFVQNSRFWENTSIVILGDHLTTERGFVPQDAFRYIYNTFINPYFSANPSRNLIKKRELSHYDFSALILDSIGIRTEAFGLGRNPLYGKTLLEQYGQFEFDMQIRMKSKVYENFWK